MNEQVRLMKQLGAFHGKTLRHDRRQNLRAAQPSAQADQLGEFFVVHFVHRLLHAVLGAIELLPHILPFALVRRLDDGFGMRGN